MTHKIVIKTGEEGGLHIHAMTGQVLTEMDQRPVWAEGYAVALLAERTGWYEKRLGQHLSDELRAPEIYNVADLGWIAFDAEGEEVEIEADTDHRMDNLAAILDVDRTDFDQGLQFKNVLTEAEVNHSYTTHPTTEATLAEVEGQGFEEVQRKVV